jgi:hypothetical protein
LSKHSSGAHLGSALLGPTDPPPLPHIPRKRLLEIALTGLGRAGARDAAAPIRRALASPASELRACAIAALGEIDPVAFKADLLAALDDRSIWVLEEAAAALLRGHVDCSRELGSEYRAVLRVYLDGLRENWEAIVRLGPVALPVLFRLANGELHDVEWGAKRTLRRMLGPWIPTLPPAGPG